MDPNLLLTGNNEPASRKTLGTTAIRGKRGATPLYSCPHILIIMSTVMNDKVAGEGAVFRKRQACVPVIRKRGEWVVVDLFMLGNNNTYRVEGKRKDLVSKEKGEEERQ